MGRGGRIDWWTARIDTTVGRIIFNQMLPERLRFRNARCAARSSATSWTAVLPPLGPDRDRPPRRRHQAVGFEYATRGGMTIAVADIEVPAEKTELLALADGQVTQIDGQYQRGLITEDERYERSSRSGRRPRRRSPTQMMDVLTRTAPSP